MFFDALTMACVADELRRTILNGRVQQVLLPDKLSVGLEIYAQHQRHYLLASAHAELGRLLLASEKLRRGVDKETGLLQLLRKYARGAIISAIKQPPFERILRLELDHPEWGCNELVIEVMGRHSNVMLVDATGRVLDAVKRVGPHLSPTRPILPGQAYAPPPPQSKLPPSALTEHRLRQILADHEAKTQVWRALVAGLRGTSPLLAREISFRALGQPRATIAQVERLTPLLDAIQDLLPPLSDEQWQPTVVLEGGQPVVYAAYPLTHRGDPQPMPSVSRAIEITIAAAASADPYAGAKRPVREAIASARARTERRQKAMQSSMHQVAEIEQLRERGEWILTYAHTIEPGQRELVAETQEGEVRIIPLDPDRSAVENAQAYFARYRKAQRAAKGGPARLEEVSLALRDLDQLETDLDLAASRPEIDDVRAALVEAGHIKSKRTKVPKSGRSQPLSLTSADGFRILVGRNSRQNDEVTFRRAKSDDWWFHARGMPGAHVIVFSEGKELPPETIRRAAELAAYFSRSRGEAQVLVAYTRRRYVRRIPRAAPGLVTYRREQSIRVAPRGPAPVGSGGDRDH
jgi:predicted ribosome quality control (RQC) complex YloA/Tae2 family protein